MDLHMAVVHLNQKQIRNTKIERNMKLNIRQSELDKSRFERDIYCGKAK